MNQKQTKVGNLYDRESNFFKSQGWTKRDCPECGNERIVRHGNVYIVDDEEKITVNLCDECLEEKYNI